jgi:enamine deaminase RidA (YjgF/YER057c/UK114 family)
MTYHRVNPDALAEPRGWNHGMLAPAGGRVLFVAGQVAMDAAGRVVGGDMAAQWERALENVLAVVAAAGGGPADIGRMTVYVTDLEAYRAARKPLGQVWRRLMGRHYPAMSVVEVKGLVDESAVVEIEATAVIPD